MNKKGFLLILILLLISGFYYATTITTEYYFCTTSFKKKKVVAIGFWGRFLDPQSSGSFVLSSETMENDYSRFVDSPVCGDAKNMIGIAATFKGVFGEDRARLIGNDSGYLSRLPVLAIEGKANDIYGFLCSQSLLDPNFKKMMLGNAKNPEEEMNRQWRKSMQKKYYEYVDGIKSVR